MRGMHMIKEERQKLLIELLGKNDIMTVTELAVILDTSMMTIRRDLEYLENKGVIKKVHGGAFLARDEYSQPSFQKRIDEFGQEKDLIGKAASRMVKDGSIVFFDAGTTTLAVVGHIPANVQFTGITTGLMTALALCSKEKAEVVSVGGYVHHTSYSSMSHIAVSLIKNFNADIAFVSTKALVYPQGAYEALLPLIEIKQAMISVSKKVVLLADHSKFESRSLSLSIPLTDIDTIITDQLTSREILDKLEAEGKEIIIAK
jgi:DeoR family fructose operon transcriptional repressor